MYDFRPNTVFGFHGCDLEVRNTLVNHPNKVIISNKPYYWLGHGMYFWENNYERAVEWAESKSRSGKVKKPAVLGAIIQLGYCCDLLDSKFTKLVGRYYEAMARRYSEANIQPPANADAPNDPYKDKLIRKLDCTTIEFMHDYILGVYDREMKDHGYSNARIFDTTRGVFTEGGPAYKGAGFFEKSHIQICVLNMNCIKGFFIPREEIKFP